MNLRSYLSRTDASMTLTEMARRLDLRIPTLHGYSTGRRAIPLPIAVAIEDLTDGLVTVREMAKQVQPPQAQLKRGCSHGEIK